MKIVVVGLGYVGLPLAVALAKHYECIGLDIDAGRVEELRAHHDRTAEIEAARLAASSLTLISDPNECPSADVYIVTVPTPIHEESKKPDLRPVIGATKMIANMIDAKRRPAIVYESTVYPGVTEDICGPLLESEGDLVRGRDFVLGYSPERINPGDKVHTVDKIVKVLAGEDAATTELLAEIYGKVTSAGVFRAASIKAAEAAKVIENAQRDINIAFINEVTQIFAKLDISIWDVLEAAGTKWNFLGFTPGLVGGHCIGVDPYYLSYRAQELGHHPQVILAGRETNDGMSQWMADWICSELGGGGGGGDLLVLGCTFKENVPDLRNSKVADLIAALSRAGHSVTVCDPHASAAEALHEYGLALDPDALSRTYDGVIGAVSHDEYAALSATAIGALMRPGGHAFDLRGMWRDKAAELGSSYRGL